MSRAQKALKRNDLIQGYVEIFRKELKRDIGFDIRGRIDREKRPVIRGAMLLAERIVYKEMRG